MLIAAAAAVWPVLGAHDWCKYDLAESWRASGRERREAQHRASTEFAGARLAILWVTRRNPFHSEAPFPPVSLPAPEGSAHARQKTCSLGRRPVRITRIQAFLVGLVLVAGVGGTRTVGAEAQTQVHTVQPGESVKDIASAYGLSSVSVMAANALANPDVLQVGQTLVIPPVDGVLHTVKAGETLVGIAADYGVSGAEVVSANGLDSPDDLSVDDVLVIPGVSLAEHAVQVATSQAAATVPVPVRGRGAVDTYVVQDGDTLRSIAENLNLDILSLVAMNALDNPDLIRPGSRLQVSTRPVEHVVQAGDTLGDIAWQYSVDANALLRANGLEDPNRLVTGMTLVVPFVAAPPPAARPSTQ